MDDKSEQTNLNNLDKLIPETKVRKRKVLCLRNILILISSFILVVISAVASFYIWYGIQLTPVDPNSEIDVQVVIKYGSSAMDIANLLKEKNLIKDVSAFQLYLKFSNQRDKLQAGDYKLSSSQSAISIVESLVKGSSNQFSITFYPGATLVDNSDKDPAKKIDVNSVLLRAGYDQREINDALIYEYESPLFDTKPDSVDLEGYIYGETYTFEVGTSVKDILSTVFNEFNSVIIENKLVEKFNTKGLTLYEGIVLASIIQREVNTGEDMNKVAGVFYNRLNLGMVLGSDVTYQYIADKLGVERDTNLNSPYNTRRFAGLTPGPIAAPGLSALLSVANPDEHDYLYFLSGDDDVTYFAENYYQHELNIVNHCKIKCSTL